MFSSLTDFGYHLMVGLAGSELRDDERELLEQLRPSGVILFGKNIDSTAADWPIKVRSLLAEVKQVAKRPDMLCAIDHEGGRVFRFTEPVTHFPAAAHWGEQAAEVGTAMARELRALGFNLNFAPVLDTLCEPKNTVIGDRALSTDCTAIAKPAIAFAKAMEAEGVLSCGKHFPGHGATQADSHFELPLLEIDRPILETRELIPFVEYIDAGFQLMLTAHVVYPALDQNTPATLSAPIVTKLLREELGFQAAVITDDLEMKALAALSPAERAVQAMKAGSDILLEGNHAEHPPLVLAQQMAEGLQEAHGTEALPQHILEKSRKRVEKLLSHCKAIGLQKKPARLEDAILGCEAHRKLSARLRERV